MNINILNGSGTAKISIYKVVKVVLTKFNTTFSHKILILKS